MAKLYGKPSSCIAGNLRKHGFIYAALIFIFIIGTFTCLFLVNQLFGEGGLLIRAVFFVAYLVVLFFLARAFNYTLYRDNFFRGGQAEDIIASQLAKLPDEYSVFRNLQINGKKADTDFILLGPKGLMTIEVKSHSGHITFDGRHLLKNDRPFQKDFLHQAQREADDLKIFLQRKYGFVAGIKPIIVFTSRYASMHFMLEPQNGVYVIQKAFLEKLIFSLPEVKYNMPNDILKSMLAHIAHK